jgi:hypothetical protein
MQRVIYSFESIPSFSNIFWNLSYYKNNLLENNKQVSLNYGKFNSPTTLGFMCNTSFKQIYTPKEQSIHSWLNMVGNLNSNRFKIYEACYFQNNPRAGYITIDYSLLWLDVITNEPFYSPVSQELSTKLKDKISLSLSLKYDVRQEDSIETVYDNTIPDNFWSLLSNSTQSKLNIIQDTLIQNREKSVIISN